MSAMEFFGILTYINYERERENRRIQELQNKYKH